MKNFFNLIRTFVANSTVWTVIVFVVFVLQSRHIGYLEQQLDKSNATVASKDNELRDLRSSVQNYLIVSGEYEKPAKDTLALLKKFGLVQEK